MTYCWVIVDPPWVGPPVSATPTARAIPEGETPLFWKKVRSSAASSACWTYTGISVSGTDSRLTVLIRAISVLPSA